MTRDEFKEFLKTLDKKDLIKISKIETESILTNTISSDEIAKMFASKNYKFFSAFLNENLVGYIILQLTDEINIVSIAVEKEHRNLGIATKLINHTEKVFKSKFNKLSLEVNEKNVSAFLLYKKLGFSIRRKRKNYYADGSTCFEMEKQLN